MTTLSLGVSCLFCENALQEDGLSAQAMPICAACSPKPLPPERRAWTGPPGHVAWRRLILTFSTGAVGFAIGGLLGWYIIWYLYHLFGFYPPETIQQWARNTLLLDRLATVVALLAGLLSIRPFYRLFLPYLFRRVPQAGVDKWKAHLITALNLERVAQQSDIAAHLVIFHWRRSRPWHITVPMEYGILLDTPQGLVFCGSPGARAIMPFTSIASVSIERPWFVWPRRTAVRLELRNEAASGRTSDPTAGNERFFSLVDEYPITDNQKWAVEMVERIRQALTAVEAGRATENSSASGERNSR